VRVNVLPTIVLEVDEDPISLVLPGPGDYVGRFVASACHRPSLTLIDIAEDGKKQLFRITKNLNYSDGTQVTSVDIQASIRKSLRVPTLQRFLLPIEAVSTPTKEDLVITLERPLGYLPSLLDSVDLSPVSQTGLGNGPYVRNVVGQELLFTPSEMWPGGDANVLVKTVRDHDKVLERFDNGEVDITCNTSFPSHLVQSASSHPSYRTSKTGIRIEVVRVSASARVPDSEFQALDESVNRLEIQAMFGDLVDTSGAKSTAKRVALARRTLVLGFFDYYPNRDICAVLQDHFHANFGRVTLRPLNFQNPDLTGCDLFLRLRFDAADHPFFDFDFFSPGRPRGALGRLEGSLNPTQTDLSEAKSERPYLTIEIGELIGHWFQRTGVAGPSWGSKPHLCLFDTVRMGAQ
jgi:hypothetical protein